MTVSLIVVYDGQIVLERYAPGFTLHTRTRTWSTAKSIAATLIGMLVDEGRLSLDSPLALDWRPPAAGAGDPREAITLRHLAAIRIDDQTKNSIRCHLTNAIFPV